jgi:O-antigen/teichoic acid export membrane protein
VWLPAGSLVAGLAAYGFLVWGGRALGTEAFAPIATLWTVQYIVMATVLFAVEQFVVRLISASERPTQHFREVAPTLWFTIIGIALAAVLVELAILGSWELALIGGSWVLTLGALTLARGIAGGRGWYRAAGIATGSESMTRFLLAILAVTVVGTTLSLALTLPCGPIPFIVWWWLRHRHKSAANGTSGPSSTTRDWRTTIGPTAAFLLTTAFANGSLQLLLGVGPLVLIGLGASPTDVSAFFATTALARAPLLIAIGIVPRVLNPLTRRATAGEYAAVRDLSWLVVAASLLVAGCAGVVGYAIGPRIVGVLYGDDFAISGMATGAAAAAVVVAMGALALNQVILAEDRSRRLVPAWTLGLAIAAVVVIALPLEPLARVSVAALTGQVAAIIGLAGAITFVRTIAPTSGQT